MNAWLLAIRELFIFRRSPADLPHAPALLSALIVMMVAIDALAARLLTGQSGDSLLALINNLVALLLVYGLLNATGKSPRFVQTATALLLVRVAMSLLTVLLLFAIAPIPEKPDDLKPGQAVLMSMTLPLLVWYVALRIHIFRHALEITLPRAFSTVIVIAALELLIGVTLAKAMQ